MLLKFLGWFWIVSGIIFLFKPDRLRNKLKKQTDRKLRRIFFGLALFFGILLIKAAWGVPGLLAKLLFIAGFLGIIKALFFLKAQAASRLIDWFLAQPVKFYRVWAASLIVFGALLLSA